MKKYTQIMHYFFKKLKNWNKKKYKKIIRPGACEPGKPDTWVWQTCLTHVNLNLAARQVQALWMWLAPSPGGLGSDNHVRPT